MTKVRALSSTKDILKAVAEKKKLNYEDVKKVYDAFITGMIRDVGQDDTFSLQFLRLGSMDINRRLLKDQIKYEGKADPKREFNLNKLNYIQYHIDNPRSKVQKHNMYTLEGKLEKLLNEEGFENIHNIRSKEVILKRGEIIKQTEKLQNGE